jgi:hypothetical protein
MTDRFDYTYHVSAVDVATPDGHAFLEQVLKVRAPQGMLADGAAKMLVDFSGGVLRDLIGLAHSSGEEAYLDGADIVGRCQ